MKKLFFILMLISFLFPAAVRAGEAAPAAGHSSGESKVVVEIPRTQWCQCVRAILGVEGGNIAGCVKSGASEEKLKIFRQRGAGDGRSNSTSFLLSFAGCAESENENVGSLSLNVQWQGQPISPSTSTSQAVSTTLSPEQAFAPVTCATGGISTVEATLYRSSKEKLAAAVPWNCSNPVGTLNNIPVSSQIGLVVTGKNASGAVLYRGEQAGIAITYKQTTALGTIAALPFTPVLSAPENAAMLGSGRVRFTWTGATGATSYRIQVSGNPGFAAPAVDIATTSASYGTVTDLASGTYYWRVKATDAYNNTSEWSTPGSITVDADPPINTTAKNFINKGAATTNASTVSLAISATKRTGVTGYYISEQSKRPQAGKPGWVAIPSIASYATTTPYPLSKRDGKKNIYVWFKDAFGHVSKVKSGAIVFDTKLPHVTITSHPAHPTNSTSAKFTYTSTKARSKFQCQLDDGVYSACSGTTSYEGLPEGTHTFTVTASDAAGNANLVPATFTWTIDTTPPHTVITSQPPVSTSSSSAQFGFTSMETTSTFECRLDGSDYAACTSPEDYPGLSMGPHTFMVRATDAAGNVDPTPAHYAWTITSSFEATITDHPSDPSNSANASFSFTSNRAGATFQCQLDSGGYSACASPLAYSGLTEDSHTFSVKASDAAANEDSEPTNYTWTISLPAAVDISSVFDGLPLPGSPAFAAMGATPPLITRPASPRELAFSAVAGNDQNGRFETGIAVDMSPYLLLKGKELSLEQYQNRTMERDLSRLQLSFAVTKGQMTNEPAMRLATAVRWIIWDDGDVRLDKDLLACMRGERQEPAGTGPETAEEARAGRSGENNVIEAPASCREESIKRNWNKSAADVGIAANLIDKEGNGGSFSSDGYGAWASVSYGFDRFDSLKNNSQIILHARYRKDEAALTSSNPNKPSLFFPRDRFSLGLQYRYGEPQLALLLQGLYVQTKSEGLAADASFRPSVGVELRVVDSVWFELEVGGIMQHTSQENPSFMTFQIKWAPSEKNATR